jgi:hypothetical protein
VPSRLVSSERSATVGLWAGTQAVSVTAPVA